jgi:hypothetical protein
MSFYRQVHDSITLKRQFVECEGWGGIPVKFSDLQGRKIQIYSETSGIACSDLIRQKIKHSSAFICISEYFCLNNFCDWKSCFPWRWCRKNVLQWLWGIETSCEFLSSNSGKMWKIRSFSNDSNVNARESKKKKRQSFFVLKVLGRKRRTHDENKFDSVESFVFEGLLYFKGENSICRRRFWVTKLSRTVLGKGSRLTVEQIKFTYCRQSRIHLEL